MVGDLAGEPQSVAGLIQPRRYPGSGARTLAAWCVTGEARAGRAQVADLADQFPIGDTHPQTPGSAPVFGLAKDTQRGLTDLLVQIGRLDAAEALLDRTAGTIVSPSRG